jgi:hypothetical protein
MMDIIDFLEKKIFRMKINTLAIVGRLTNNILFPKMR